MKTLDDKMKQIQKKVQKANAIERNLQNASKDYMDGYYFDSADAANRLLVLDSKYPAGVDLISKANSNVYGSKPRRILEGEDEKNVKSEVIPTPSSPVVYGTHYCNENCLPFTPLLRWFFYAICAAVICFLLFLVIKNYAIPAICSVGYMVSVVVGYVWPVLKVCLIVVAVIIILFVILAVS